jgi:hypothetical protein
VSHRTDFDARREIYAVEHQQTAAEALSERRYVVEGLKDAVLVA